MSLPSTERVFVNPKCVVRVGGVDMPPDEELIRRVLDGDPWAKEALYRRHAAAVFRTALRLLENRADAEDVVQDAFVTMYASIATLRDPSAFASWLLRITVHQAHRRFRRRRLLRLLGLDRSIDDATLETLATDGADPETRHTLARLDRELGRLPARHRTAWVLRRVEGYSIEEVSAACECSLATAKRWIAAAHERISLSIEIEVEVSDEA